MQNKDKDPKQEGHAKEWQDRARVVLDAKEALQQPSSDKQSPLSDAQDRKMWKKKVMT